MKQRHPEMNLRKLRNLENKNKNVSTQEKNACTSAHVQVEAIFKNWLFNFILIFYRVIAHILSYVRLSSSNDDL